MTAMSADSADESDLPLGGMWIECDKEINDVFLWTLFTEYVKNPAIRKLNVHN